MNLSFICKKLEYICILGFVYIYLYQATFEDLLVKEDCFVSENLVIIASIFWTNDRNR